MAMEMTEQGVATPAPKTARATTSRDDLLRPLPKLTLRAVMIVIAIIGVYTWGLQGTRADADQLVKGVPNMVAFVQRLFPLDFDWTAVAKLPFEVQLPFTIHAVKYSDTLDGDAQLQAAQDAIVNAVPLDLALSTGQSMDAVSPGSNEEPSPPAAGEMTLEQRLQGPWFTLQPSTLNRVWLPGILPYVFETLQMAIIGTTLAIFLALPFGLMAARNTSPHPVVYQTSRMVMNANRAVPELIVALVFVAALGLGPFTGVLALAIASIGSLGRLYSEAIEQIDPQQVMAVRATGGNRLQVFGFSVVPQVLPLITSYSLVYFEHNVRAATILGIVGAGGVGLALQKYIGLFEFRELMGAVLVLVIAVTIIDRISARVRQKLI